MSQSTPLKRKKDTRKSRFLLSDSDDETQHFTKSSKHVKRSDTFKAKVVDNIENSEEEETGIFYLVQFLNEPNKFDIVAEKQIRIDKHDPNTGRVKHYSSNFEVRIVKRGTEDYVKKMAEKFRYNLSLLTSDEVETDKHLKMIKAQNLIKSLPPSSGKGLMDTHLDPPPHSSSSINSNEVIFQSQNYEKSNVIEKENINLKIDDERLRAQLLKIDQIEKIVENLTKSSEKKVFVFSGVDLVKDVDGYPAHIWAKNCLSVLFTSEEINKHVLVKSKNSSRIPCCPEKVNLLKEALAYKYNFPAEKNDKVWKKVVTAFNTKGRGIKHRLNLAKNSVLSSIGITSNSK